MNDDDVKQLWQAQPVPAAAYTEQQLRQRASRFQRSIGLRNAIETLAALLVIACFAHYIWLFPQPLIRLGSAMIIVAACVTIDQLYRRAARRALPGDAMALSCLDFHKAELARQRDALNTVWLWYIGPFVPGMIVFRWGVETQLAASAPFARGWLANLAVAVVLLAIVWLNRRAARKLQRQIDDLTHADH